MLIVSLFAITSPAQAAVEAVAPTSTQLICTSSELGCSGAPAYYDGVGDFPFFIKYTFESAQTWCSSKNLEWNYLSNVDPYGGFAAYYRCDKWVFALINDPCPTATPAYTFNPASGMCERPKLDCPVNSTRSDLYPFQCICHAGYEFDPIGGICKPLRECPVTALPAFPPANDACAQALENFNSTQAQKDAACGTLTPAMQTGQTCLENKLAAMTPAAIPFVRTGDIRSVAYQAHFRDIWDKMEELVDWMENNPIVQTLCADRRAEIAAEKGCDNAGPCAEVDATTTTPAIPACYPASATRRSHCLTATPAKPDPNSAQHTQGNAIDVSRKRTINPLKAALAGRNPPLTIPQFLDATPNCNLKWGGEFKTNYDPVHFFAR